MKNLKFSNFYCQKCPPTAVPAVQKAPANRAVVWWLESAALTAYLACLVNATIELLIGLNRQVEAKF